MIATAPSTRRDYARERITSALLRAGVAAKCRLKMREYALAWRVALKQDRPECVVALWLSRAVQWRERALAFERGEP